MTKRESSSYLQHITQRIVDDLCAKDVPMLGSTHTPSYWRIVCLQSLLDYEPIKWLPRELIIRLGEYMMWIALRGIQDREEMRWTPTVPNDVQRGNWVYRSELHFLVWFELGHEWVIPTVKYIYTTHLPPPVMPFNKEAVGIEVPSWWWKPLRVSSHLGYFIRSLMNQNDPVDNPWWRSYQWLWVYHVCERCGRMYIDRLLRGSVGCRILRTEKGFQELHLVQYCDSVPGLWEKRDDSMSQEWWNRVI